jgi:hypothetical protein
VVAFVASAFALVMLLGAAPAAARPAQDPGVTTIPVDRSTTTLPGSTTVAAVPAAGSETEPATEPTEPAEVAATGSNRVADENRKIWAVVAALVLVAIALSLLTIRYWRKTRPVSPDADADADADADEPVAEVDEVMSGTDSAGELPDDAVNDAANDTAPVPVVDAPLAVPASPRRAVAGADHASADEAWEPRGTGEHERVVVASTARANRLSTEQRAALFAQRPPRDL